MSEECWLCGNQDPTCYVCQGAGFANDEASLEEVRAAPEAPSADSIPAAHHEQEQDESGQEEMPVVEVLPEAEPEATEAETRKLRLLPPTPAPARSPAAPAPVSLRWELRTPEGLKPAECASQVTLVEIGGLVAPRRQVRWSGQEGASPCVPFLRSLERKKLLASPEAVKVLQWMMKKAALGQDIALLGDFSGHARSLARAFCELRGLEAEFLALSRDTAEADLTEQAELVLADDSPGDQTGCLPGHVTTWRRPAAPVRAARTGKVLILQGLERAEPNTLSVLNNLLENRELPLASGLLSRCGAGDLAVSPDFLVIALCVPPEKHPKSGLSALDPPVRSRFAARIASPPTLSKEDEVVLGNALTSFSLEALKGIVADLTPSTLALHRAAEACRVFPKTMTAAAIHAVWPYSLLLASSQCEAVNKALTGSSEVEFRLATEASSDHPYTFCSTGVPEDRSREISFGTRETMVTCSAACGRAVPGEVDDRVSEGLAALLQDHCLDRDVLLVGERGCGKSQLVRTFAELMGYECQVIFCTSETDARDLGLRRIIRPDGTTAYEDSPVVAAAIAGDLLVLEGVDRLPTGLLHCVLAQLFQDRVQSLCDGRTLLRPGHWSALVGAGISETALHHAGFLRVHPSFRIMATAELRNTKHWMEASLLSLFGSVRILPWAPIPVTSALLPDHPRSTDYAKALLEYNKRLRDAAERDPQDFGPYILSWRQLTSIGARIAKGRVDPSTAVRRCFGARLSFVPRPLQETVDRLLAETVGEVEPVSKPASVPKLHVTASTVTFGAMQIARGPDTDDMGGLDAVAPMQDRADLKNSSYVDVPEHLGVLHGMMAEWSLGHHLLLVGPQGVGKNRIADRFCDLLGRRREYIELHRDSSLARLTRTPILERGCVAYQDSALLHAATAGHVLIVDEVDKAPLEVACVLRELADRAAELQLPDGRRMRRDPNRALPGDLVTHKDFCMILLANPPGHPFAGHDFFQECGDVFSGFAVESMGVESEGRVLRSCAPTLTKSSMLSLLSTSAALRRAHADGKLKYPYSTREMLQVARHVNAFPVDNLRRAFQDVVAFDAYDKAAKPTLDEILDRTLGKLTELDLASLQVSLHEAPSDSLQKFIDVGGVSMCSGMRQPTLKRGQLGAARPVANPSDRGELRPEEVMRELELLEIAPGSAEWGDTVESYEVLCKRLQSDIVQIRDLLERRRIRDRIWQRRQCAGPELDDGALVEAVCGASNVFRRRAVPPAGSQPRGVHAKRLKFVMDLSSSMMTFNGMDGRLERLLEAIVLMMEALIGFEAKYCWSLSGHSGDSPDIPLVAWDAPPQNFEERAALLHKMAGVASTCGSGDFTLKAVERATEDCMQGEADERFVFVVSDANLARYKIDPADLGKALLKNPSVRSYLLMVADEGDRALAKLPAGRAFVCPDTKKLVGAFRDIFTSSVGLDAADG